MSRADSDDDAADAADPTLHLLACWPAVGRQPLKYVQMTLYMDPWFVELAKLISPKDTLTAKISEYMYCIISRDV